MPHKILPADFGELATLQIKECPFKAQTVDAPHIYIYADETARVRNGSKLFESLRVTVQNEK